MSNQFRYEDGQGHVDDEYGCLEPMDYVVDEEVYALQTVSSHTEYLRGISCERNHESVATHVDKPKDKDICMRERTPKRAYTIYTDQDRAPVKKRKRAGHSEAISRGTVTGHHLSFLKATMMRWTKYEQMKGHYLVMDNALFIRLTISLGVSSLEGIDVPIFHHTRLNSILLSSFGQLSRAKLSATGTWKARR
ncbi:hypothetical protein VTP01DRAFT_10462 [Rhizomucor pusillus]|uniref:uncharacterized protein n=1 Tax=Rhizomucor pusillus TaxID=4840 RepID=UPI0037439B02